MTTQISPHSASGGGSSNLNDLFDVNLIGVAQGDILYYDGDFWINLAAGAPGEVLTVSGGVPIWSAPGGGSTHAMLSATHTDSTPAAVLRGALITGQGATPSWSLLAIGGSGTVPKSNGVDIAWDTLAIEDLVDGGDIVLTDASGANTKIAIFSDASNIHGGAGAETFTYDGNDVVFYKASNDANPEIRIGSTDAEEFHVQVVFDTGAQTLDHVLFVTDVASATADKGLFKFNVDGVDILDIDDDGINLSANSGISIAGTNVLDRFLGLNRLANIGTVDSGTADAIEASIDTLNNLTSATSLATLNALTSATSLTTLAALTTVGTLTTGNADAIVSASSTTTAGKIEVATVAETDTGTDATRCVSPDALAGSYAGTKTVQSTPVNFTVDVTTGTGKDYIHITPELAGMNLVGVHAEVITAGVTGTSTFQLVNVTQASANMLSTLLSVDSGETGSDTAATPAVIDAANDDVAENDLLRWDVSTVSSTPPKGLILTATFRKP